MYCANTLSGRRAANFGVSWEDAYGYAQAVEVEGIVYVSGQLSHDRNGALVAPAPLDDARRPTSFANTEAQLLRAYENAAELLAEFGATLDDVVEETLFVIDVDAGFAAAGKVRKEMYASGRPRVASNIIGVSRLAFPEALVEVTFRAVPGRGGAAARLGGG